MRGPGQSTSLYYPCEPALELPVWRCPVELPVSWLTHQKAAASLRRPGACTSPLQQATWESRGELPGTIAPPDRGNGEQPSHIACPVACLSACFLALRHPSSTCMAFSSSSPFAHIFSLPFPIVHASRETLSENSSFRLLFFHGDLDDSRLSQLSSTRALPYPELSTPITSIGPISTPLSSRAILLPTSTGLQHDSIGTVADCPCHRVQLNIETSALGLHIAPLVTPTSHLNIHHPPPCRTKLAPRPLRRRRAHALRNRPRSSIP